MTRHYFLCRYYDQFSHEVRKALQEAPFNVCEACVLKETESRCGTNRSSSVTVQDVEKTIQKIYAELGEPYPQKKSA